MHKLITSNVQLADEINREHDAATESARRAIAHARRCGELLIHAKEQVGHGGFLRWLESHCHVGDRQARRYMTIAKNWDTIESKSGSGSDLTVKSALRLLDDRSEPEGQFEDCFLVLHDVKTGDAVVAPRELHKIKPTPWLIGDWLLYGEDQGYTADASSIFGLTDRTLKCYLQVSRKFRRWAGNGRLIPPDTKMGRDDWLEFGRLIAKQWDGFYLPDERDRVVTIEAGAIAT